MAKYGHIYSLSHIKCILPEVTPHLLSMLDKGYVYRMAEQVQHMCSWINSSGSIGVCLIIFFVLQLITKYIYFKYLMSMFLQDYNLQNKPLFRCRLDCGLGQTQEGFLKAGIFGNLTHWGVEIRLPASWPAVGKPARALFSKWLP